MHKRNMQKINVCRKTYLLDTLMGLEIDCFMLYMN